MIPRDVISPPPNTQLPPYLIVQFWAQIYEKLQSSHGLSASDAATAVRAYREDVEPFVGDMIYHSNWYDEADTIATGWWSGYLQLLAQKNGKP